MIHKNSLLKFIFSIGFVMTSATPSFASSELKCSSVLSDQPADNAQLVAVVKEDIIQLGKKPILVERVSQIISNFLSSHRNLSEVQILEMVELLIGTLQVRNNSDMLPNSREFVAGEILSLLGSEKDFAKYQTYAVAKAIANENGLKISEYIKNFKNLTGPQLFEIAKLAANQNGFGVTMYMDRYIGLTNDQVFQVAKIAASQNGFGVSRDIKNYKGLTNSQLFEIAKISIASNVQALPYITQNFHLTDRQYRRILRTALASSEAYASRQYAQKARDVGQVASLISPLSELSPEFFEQHNGIPELKLALRQVLINRVKPWNQTHRAINEKAEIEKLLEYAWYPIERREFGLNLIEEGLRLISRGRVLPNSVGELVAQQSGLKLELISEKTSSNTLGDVYELALDVQKNLLAPLFKEQEIPLSFYQSPSQLIEFLTLIRDIKSIRGNSADGAQFILNFLKKTPKEQWLALLRQEVVRQFLPLFPSAKNEEEEFSYKNLHNLNMSWGNLDAIITLAARYSGFSQGSILLKNLKRIFSASLKGNFNKFKFEGFTSEEKEIVNRQLAMLTAEQRVRLQKQRTVLEVFNPKEVEGESVELRFNQQRAQIKSVVQTNLLVHLREFIDKKASQESLAQDRALVQFLITSKASQAETLEQAALKLLNQNSETLKKNRHLELEAMGKILFTLVNEIILFSDNSSKFSSHDLAKLISIAEYLVRNYTELVGHKNAEQVSRDFSTLRSFLKNEMKGEKTNQFLVLSVFSGAPKFLLTIGDSVRTSSCQNFRTGAHIEALLGYVMDAHVQAMVSYTISSADFKSEQDFQKVYATLQKEGIHYSFNADKTVAEFRWPDGRIVETHPLRYGYLRQVVKLGTEYGTHRPALFQEREYVQMHRAINQMRRQFREIISQLGQDIGATSDAKTVRIEGSRNEFGHYSDAAGGPRVDSYLVK